nr:nuclease associated modular domain 3 [Tanacetum cinerariifolium]
MIASDNLQIVRQRDEDLSREIAMLSGSAWVVHNKEGIVEDASEIEQIGVNGAVETATLVRRVYRQM